ncbi:hypothetical protein [Miniphocaeibacter halophilus]|uniref:Uncharacterized protein n=1 Tax=Miniphocaeibacter halophilus TaxID=2931922 RepID=A0AC61MRN6_9FIRM|nr:hypothetical protein [Miniphocaeibacter halophilus]QQK06948.1 hypothetical protein JFY71_06260 [Miniphocaeibacter halophilus]
MKKTLSLIMIFIMTLSLVSCKGNNNSTTDVSKTEVQAKKSEDVPTISISWGNEMHTGIMYLPFISPELFEDEEIRINPVSESQGELQVKGETIAILNQVVTKGGSEVATLMGQKHLDVGYTSSTAMLTAYDTGTEISILCPIQSDGVAIAATKDASYNTFEEFVEYAKIPNNLLKQVIILLLVVLELF